MNESESMPVARLLQRMVPDWIVHYHKDCLRPDIIAGLTAAAVVIPKALAYATVAGLPIQVGLYTAFVPMAIYAVLGGSRALSVSTTATLAILGATALARAVPGGDAQGLLVASATLTLLVGAILLVASVLRLGFVANFISDPVLTGFKGGIAVVIVLDQVPKLLGIHFNKGSFLQNVMSILAGVPETSIITLAVGAATVGILLALEHFTPRMPAPLIAVAAGIGGVALLGLQAFGVETVGHVPTGLPDLVLPAWSMVNTLWPPAVGIALMSFTETIAAGRAFARHGDPAIGANRELFATGMANLGGALLGSMPAGGGTSQTAVNRLAGARTQLAALVTSALALGTMLLLAPLIGRLPQATLAAVVIVYSVGLFDPAEFRAILRVRRTEFYWAVTAMVGVVLLGTLQGIVVAIAVSLVALAHQMADPPVHELRRKPGTGIYRPVSTEHPDDRAIPGLLIVRPEGRVFFANAGRLGQKLRAMIEDSEPLVVALDFSAVFDLEYTALKMLTEAEKTYRDAGTRVWLVGLSPSVLAFVQRSSLGETLGREGMFLDLAPAVARFQREQAAMPPPLAPSRATAPSAAPGSA